MKYIYIFCKIKEINIYLEIKCLSYLLISSFFLKINLITIDQNYQALIVRLVFRLISICKDRKDNTRRKNFCEENQRVNICHLECKENFFNPLTYLEVIYNTYKCTENDGYTLRSVPVFR